MGRPREFDRDQAVQIAMQLFWKKGFEKVSLKNLLEEMGISNSSFYHAFRNKEDLFEEALNYYFHKIGAMRTAPLQEGKSVKESLRNYFDRLIQINLDPKLPGGCLIANSTQLVASKNPRISTKTMNKIQASLDRLEFAFYTVFKEGQDRGEVRPDLDARLQSRLFVSIVFGLNIIARVFKDRKQMEDVAHAAIQLIIR
jgi:TetR/AcrR family transcriptional repressor of nem operon